MIKVAVCDDDKRDLDKIYSVLSNIAEKHYIDMKIFSCTDGEKLLEDRKEFDIIFLDIEMANIDGIKIAENIRKFRVCSHKTIAFFK